jgi:hypothetical protein
MIGKITKQDRIKNPKKPLNPEILKKLLKATDSLDKTIVSITPKAAVNYER